ncbi:hypothetical protein RHMOL_Rhmol07G0233400 [Rhododendron molle]|uniref:Uncharacterized protein n=1 Tax=Rhododendron molle TaxID=49168 RepID=A0ACC0N529_RHOML|nr:hypothetical protein RHMOL_Rhmol07G0233400 [Rhododendron molle]
MHAVLSTESTKNATTLASGALDWHRSASVGNIINCGTTVTTEHRQIASAALTAGLDSFI